MTPMESRKRLLIAESELNRAQLIVEWQAMAGDVRSIARRAKSISSIALATASLISGVVAFRRTRPGPGGEKPSWWRVLLKGAQLAGSLWSEFGSRPKS
jgi:hypothetical protein